MRIHSSLTAARETFVYNLLINAVDTSFEDVNKTLASEDNKALWGGKDEDGQPRPLTMAFKRVNELREAAKVAIDHVKNGLPVPPVPPSSLKKVKAPKADIVADAPTNDTVIVTNDITHSDDVVIVNATNDTASVADSAELAV